MNTYGDVKAEVRGLVGDQDAQWANDAYLATPVNTAYRLQVLALKNATGQNLEGVVLLPAVEAGTTTLYDQQAVGKPLCGMYTVLELWSKPAGMPPNYFRRAEELRSPAHVAPPLQPQGLPAIVTGYCWLGNKLLITPPAGPVDIEVMGRFNPGPLAKDTDVLVASPDMQSVTALKAASICGVERTNPALLVEFKELAEIGLQNIIAELVRQKQGMGIRAGLMDGGRHGWYGYRRR